MAIAKLISFALPQISQTKRGEVEETYYCLMFCLIDWELLAVDQQLSPSV